MDGGAGWARWVLLARWERRRLDVEAALVASGYLQATTLLTCGRAMRRIGRQASSIALVADIDVWRVCAGALGACDDTSWLRGCGFSTGFRRELQERREGRRRRGELRD